MYRYRVRVVVEKEINDIMHSLHGDVIERDWSQVIFKTDQFDKASDKVAQIVRFMTGR